MRVHDELGRAPLAGCTDPMQVLKSRSINRAAHRSEDGCARPLLMDGVQMVTAAGFIAVALLTIGLPLVGPGSAPLWPPGWPSSAMGPTVVLAGRCCALLLAVAGTSRVLRGAHRAVFHPGCHSRTADHSTDHHLGTTPICGGRDDN